jgi:hypothetical protein
MENQIVQYAIGGGIMLVVFVLLAWAGKRAVKQGEIDKNKHWQDY